MRILRETKPRRRWRSQALDMERWHRECLEARCEVRKQEVKLRSAIYRADDTSDRMRAKMAMLGSVYWMTIAFAFIMGTAGALLMQSAKPDKPAECAPAEVKE